jgi:hypothetical protein
MSAIAKFITGHNFRAGVLTSAGAGSIFGVESGLNDSKYEYNNTKLFTNVIKHTLTGTLVGAAIPFAVLSLPVVYPVIKLYEYDN